MKKLLFIMFLFSSSLYASESTAYLLWCRTPLEINSEGTLLTVTFNQKLSGVAGTRGEKLKPGTCGFIDRGTKPAEPNIIQINSFKTEDDSDTNFERETLELQTIKIALFTANTLIGIPVRNKGEGLFIPDKAYGKFINYLILPYAELIK